MKYILYYIIYSLLFSCSSTIKGRQDTLIAKKNFLSVQDFRYLDKKYDWEVVYDSNTDYYANELESTQKRLANRSKLQTKELRSILKDSYIQSLKGRVEKAPSVEKGALITERLFRYIDKKRVFSQEDVKSAVSDYLYDNKVVKDSSEEKLVLNHSRKIAEYLGYATNFKSEIKGDKVSTPSRSPASVPSDIVNDDKISFKSLNELDYVRILVRPTDFVNKLKEIVLNNRSSFSRLSDQEINIVGNLYIDEVKDKGYINSSGLAKITKHIGNFVKQGNYVSKNKISAVNRLLKIIDDDYKSLVRSKIEAKVLQDRTTVKKYVHFSSEEVMYHLQSAYETQEFDDSNMAKKIANQVYLYLTKYTLYNEGLNRDQFGHVFEILKDKLKHKRLTSLVEYYKNYLSDYVERSRKFNSFDKVRQRYVADEKRYFMIDELPSELKGIVDEKNAFLLSITLEENKGLMELKKENSLFMRDLIASARTRLASRSVASTKKVENVFKLHGIDGNSYFYSGEQLNFFLASKIATPETLKAIKSLGTDINARNEEGKTALFIAIENNRYENVKALLDLGADIKLKDSRGRSVENYIQNVEDDRIEDLIRSRIY